METGNAHATASFRIISYQPLVLDFPDFLDAGECCSIIRAVMRCAPNSPTFTCHDNQSLDPDDKRLLPEEVAVLHKLLTYVGDLLRTPTHRGEVKPRCGFTAAANHDSRMLPRGLHLDTNRRERRFATAIVYLATLDKAADGCTVFPCARRGEASATACDAATKLLRTGYEHTLSTPCKNESVEALHHAAIEDAGLSIEPKVGRLAIFFSRDHNGCIDPASFHGGAAVCQEPSFFHEGLPKGKWTMQIFKEVPRDASCTIESYAADRWRSIVSSKGRHTSRAKKRNTC